VYFIGGVSDYIHQNNKNSSVGSVGKFVGLPPIQSVSCGDNHTVLVGRNGSVYSFGDNKYGQLAVGNRYDDPVLIPLQAFGVGNIRKAFCAYNHTLLLSHLGHVIAYGDNEFYQLGSIVRIIYDRPNTIPGLESIRTIACGKSHTLAIDNEGKVFAFGYNKDGQLGFQGFNDYYPPSLIPGIPPIRTAAAGNYPSNQDGNNGFTILIDFKGNVYSCGANVYGELGLGDTAARKMPVLVQGIPPMQSAVCVDAITFLLAFNGDVYFCGRVHMHAAATFTFPTKITGLPPIRRIYSNSEIRNIFRW
jgi:alpha-tubulin suppressor-like RCC1 family protein